MAAPASAAHSDPLGAFRHRGYAIFWTGALISNIGTWLGNLTVPYVLYQHTGSAVWVGLAGAAQFGPSLIVSPLGGTLADTCDRRRLLLWTQGGLGLIAALMWLQWASGLHIPILLIALLTMFGMLNGLNNPAWQSLVHDLVPRADLMSAVTLNSLQFNLARAIGPAVAGVLLAAWGAPLAFFLNAVSFGIVVVALLLVRRHPSHPIVRARGRFLRQWRDATAYVLGTPAMLLAIALCCVVGLFGNPIFTLTVVFAEEVFATGPVGLGMLTAALGVGAALYACGGMVRRQSPRRTLGHRTALAMIVLGGSLVVMGVVPTLPLGIVAALAIGAAFLAVFAALNTSIQLRAPDELRGRVLAVRHMVFSASIALGVLLGGTLTDLWGVQLATIIFGAAPLAVAGAVPLVVKGGFRLLDVVTAAPGDPSSESDPLP